MCIMSSAEQCIKQFQGPSVEWLFRFPYSRLYSLHFQASQILNYLKNDQKRQFSPQSLIKEHFIDKLLFTSIQLYGLLYFP